MTDPLPAWRGTATREAILGFIEDVTLGTDALDPADRVAVFDNDGTLWAEKPMPVQLHFGVERWREMAAADSSLAERQPYQAAVTGDLSWLSAAIDQHYAGDDTRLHALIGALVESQADIEVTAFGRMVDSFLQQARHPTLQTPYSHTVYQPMVELLTHLRACGFNVYITSGGDRDFMRRFAQDLYGVPAESVIGSSLGLEYREDERGGTITYGRAFDFFDDGPQKPIRIWSRTGRRPVFAGGNSDGDMPMLSFVQGNERSLSLLVHHDDPDRGDIPYDAGATQALAAAQQRGWTVVSVKQDWGVVFPESG